MTLWLLTAAASAKVVTNSMRSAPLALALSTTHSSQPVHPSARGSELAPIAQFRMQYCAFNRRAPSRWSAAITPAWHSSQWPTSPWGLPRFGVSSTVWSIPNFRTPAHYVTLARLSGRQFTGILSAATNVDRRDTSSDPRNLLPDTKMSTHFI